MLVQYHSWFIIESFPVREGTCVDPPLCRGNSHGIGEVGERELVLVVNVKCGKE